MPFLRLKSQNFSWKKDMKYRENRKMNRNGGAEKRERMIAFLLFVVLFLCVSGSGFRVNAFDNYKPILARIPIYCSPVSDKPDAVYEIRIQKITENAPFPETDKLSVKGADTGVFELEVTEPGTYKYRVSQISGKSSDISYDNKVYDVYLCVTDNGTEELVYSISVTLENSAIKPDEIYFENYVDNVKPPTPPSEDPPSEDPPARDPDSNPSADRTGRITGSLFSMKTGENNSLYIGIFAGTMVLLAAGAVVYILIKRNSDRNKND